VVLVAVMYGIGIAMAPLAGAGIGLLVMAAHYQRAAAQRRRYEQEVAQDAELYAAARASLRRYQGTGPRDSTAPGP